MTKGERWHNLGSCGYVAEPEYDIIHTYVDYMGPDKSRDDDAGFLIVRDSCEYIVSRRAHNINTI